MSRSSNNTFQNSHIFRPGPEKVGASLSPSLIKQTVNSYRNWKGCNNKHVNYFIPTCQLH